MTRTYAWACWILSGGAVAACSQNAGQAAGQAPGSADGGATGPTAAGAEAGTAADGGTSGTFDFGDAGGGDGGVKGSRTLTAVVRDFRLYSAGDPSTVPDFENVPRTDQNGTPNAGYTGPWDDRAIVTSVLGADGNPVYKDPAGTTLTTHGREAFDTWFRDVPGRNARVEVPIVLTQTADGAFEYDSDKTGTQFSSTDPKRMFLPIDDGTPFGTAFGNQGQPHNFSFTVELRTTFTYAGGEFFRFRGDDDVFVYIDHRLVINLGGIHDPEIAEVQADTLGLTKGQDYPLDFFSAERHVYGSNILFTTTLNLRPAPK